MSVDMKPQDVINYVVRKHHSVAEDVLLRVRKSGILCVSGASDYLLQSDRRLFDYQHVRYALQCGITHFKFTLLVPTREERDDVINLFGELW